jgi:acetyltransferase-like isoleucine patch superfamily enzyme
LGRATCVLAANARLSARARILNAGGSSARIQIGRNSVVEGELFVFAHGGTITIGEWCYIGPGTRLWSAASLSVGDRVLISHGVNVFDSLTHPLGARLRHHQFKEIATRGHPRSIDLSERPVIIEDDAWIGAGAFVLKGVRVGSRSVVGAGALVTRDVPPGVVVAGNPARIIRALTPEELEL